MKIIGYSIGLFIISSSLLGLPIDLLKIPPGFKIDIYAKVDNAREMAVTKQGIVFVGSRTAGKVYAVLPNKSLTKATTVLTIAKNLKLPNGVAYHNGNLYVAALNKILCYQNIDKYLSTDKITQLKPKIITTQLPNKTWHGSRYIGFGPDGWLYLSIGAPCNVCLVKDPFASIIRFNIDTHHWQIYARGVRNSMGFAWDPETKQLWFTDNGRDWLGDELPPDELNTATTSNLHFGFPYYYGDNIADPHFKHHPKGKYIEPAFKLPAHVAPLGMTFYQGQIVVAEHGSWNRSKKIGYQVIMVKLVNHQPVFSKVLVSGWLQKQHFWGRPVDVKTMPDGALLISDDYAGIIYRMAKENLGVK